MKENNVDSNILKPVSPETLTTFDASVAAVEEDVARQCLSSDTPERAVGPEAGAMIKSGLGFVSKMLRAMMAYGAGNIINDELEWGKTRLPVYGVSMKMVLNNFERYAKALEKTLPATAYEEVRPYLASMIQKQYTMVKETNGKK